MAEMFAGGSAIVILALVVLGILMPVCVYTAQKYAFRCYKELVKANQVLARIDASIDDKNT